MIKKSFSFFTRKAGKIIILSAAVFLVSGCSLAGIKSPGQSETEGTAQEDPVSIPEGNSYFNYILSELQSYRQDRQKSFDFLVKAQKKDPESRYLKKQLAGHLLLYKKPEIAKDLISGMLEETPDDTELLAIQAGILALEKKDPLEISEIYKKILELDPENKKAPIALAFLYEKTDKRKELIEIFEKAEKQSKHNYFLYFYLGEAYLLEKNYTQAKKTLYRAVKEEPYRIEPKLSLIETIKNLEKTSEHKKEIIDLFNEIIELKPNDTAPLIELSFFYNQNGDYEKSDETFRAVAEEWNIEKKKTAALINFYVKNGSAEKADFAAMRIFQATGDSSVFMILGSIYSKEGLKDKAFETYMLVPETSDLHPEASAASALILASRGEIDKAVSQLEQNLEKKPQNIVLLSALGNLYEEKKDFEKAEKTYLTGASVKSDKQWSFFYRLGVINDKAGNRQKAVEYMKKALELDPENPDTLNYLGYTYAEMGIELETAREMIEKALAIRPGDGYITDSLGWVYFKIGNYEKAEHYLKKAAEKVKNDPVIFEHLGDLYFKTEKKEIALEMYKKALELAPGNIEIKTKLKKIKE